MPELVHAVALKPSPQCSPHIFCLVSRHFLTYSLLHIPPTSFPHAPSIRLIGKEGIITLKQTSEIFRTQTEADRLDMNPGLCKSLWLISEVLSVRYRSSLTSLTVPRCKILWLRAATASTRAAAAHVQEVLQEVGQTHEDRFIASHSTALH